MSQDLHDRRLVEAAQADTSRFSDLYETHFYKVYAYVVRRVGDRHHAEDLTSEVFQEALAGISSFEWRDVPFAAWLFGIASRLIADHWKRLGRESEGPFMECSGSAPDGIESRALLFQLVDRLPEAQYRVIHMRFVEQKSIREIAQELGRSEGAVKQLQLRAIEKLRHLWGDSHA